MQRMRFFVLVGLLFVFCSFCFGKIVTQTFTVAAEADDGISTAEGVQDINGSNLAIGTGGSNSVPFPMGGMRFSGVSIPRRSMIIDARLKIKSLGSDYRGQVYGKLAVELSDNAADYSARQISNAATGTSSITWDHKTNWAANSWQTSPNISSLLKQVIDRTGWFSGNALAVYYSTRATSNKQRSYGAYSSGAAQLEVTYEYFTISGKVKTSSGAGLAGVTVSAGDKVEPTVTDENGYYELHVRREWLGGVTVTKEGWNFSPSSRPYLYVTSDIANQDYTAMQPVISGSTGIAGATVTFSGIGSVTSTPNYSVAVPYNWSGSVSVSKEGYGFTGSPRMYSRVISNKTNQNFTPFQPKISGSTVVSGATVTVSGIGTFTSTPNYSVVVPYGWSGTVSVIKEGYNFPESPRSYNNVTSSKTSQDFDPFQPTISGWTSVWGTVVTVSGVGSFTAPSSTYSVVVPYGWSGTVSVSKDGYNFPDSPRTYTDVKVNKYNQNFTAYQPKISGYVKKSDGTGFANIAVTAGNGVGSVMTDSEGYYQLVLPHGWSGDVAAKKAAWQISPVSYSFSDLMSDKSGQDFTASYVGVIIVKADGTGDYPTIQAAIDASSDGDIVQVADGTYTGSGNRDIDFNGKAITVRGNVEDPNLVVIDCQGTEADPHRGFIFKGREGNSSVLEGFKVKNGVGAVDPGQGSWGRGGGIYISNSGPRIEKCIITNCQGGYGGGFYCNTVNNVVIEDCMITNNSSGAGGGLYGFDGTISNCIVSGNSNCGFYDSDGTISNCIVSSNSGSGFSLCDGSITNCTVRGNSAYHGGGFYNCAGTISDCVISGNLADVFGGGFYGCGGTIKNCTVSGNSANSGGGLFGCNGIISNCVVSGNSGGGFGACSKTITDCKIENNAASYGGGFYLCDATITNCTVRGNSADYRGGGFYECDGTISNCTVTGNSASSWGGGFYECDGKISNCTVVGNAAYPMGGGFYRCNGMIMNCIVWGNTADSNSQLIYSAVPIYSCIQGWTAGGIGNILDDPLFVDAANGDYHLLIDSPCINTGDPNHIADPNETDIDGDSRVVCRLDIGADEFYVSSSGAIVANHKGFSFTSAGLTGNTKTDILALSNCGAYDSSWSIVNDCQWLSVAPLTGETASLQTSLITVGVDVSKASYGSQSCQFQIVDPCSVTGPQTVTVNLQVLRPGLSVSGNSFSYTADGLGGDVSEQVLTITNSGYDTLDWTITKAAECEWLALSSSSGQTVSGTSAEVSLSVNPAVAGYGLHSCELTVSDPDADNSPQTVTVSFEVLGPVIGLTAGMFNFECEVDEPNVLTEVLSISNIGYDVLKWSISEDCDWLSVSPVSGECIAGPNELSEVVLTVDTAGLEIGVYTCWLTITDDNASIRPRTVPVKLHVYRVGERHVPLEYPNIMEAVKAAVDGDHVIIHPGFYGGLYNNRIAVNGRNIVIRSVDPEDMEIVEKTIISGSGSQQIYGIYASGPVENNHTVIEGLVFEGFLSQAIHCKGGSAEIKNCVFRNNSPMYNASVVWLKDCSAVIENCEFVNSYLRSEKYHGAVVLIENLNNPDVQAVLRNCLIGVSYRDRYYTNLLSSGVYVYGGNLDVSNCTIAYNYREFDDEYPGVSSSPGILVRQANVSINNSIIWGNEADDGSQIGIIASDPVGQYELDDARVSVSNSNIESGLENVIVFPDYNAFLDYGHGKPVDPNLVDPNVLTWGGGNIDVDPLFVHEPNDGGDGWFDDRYTEGVDESANNDYGDLHLKSSAGRYLLNGYSRADFNFDNRVDLADFSIFSQVWGLAAYGWGPLSHPCNLDGDTHIGQRDLALFCGEYLDERVFGEWVVDDVTSPCIDAGDAGDDRWRGELWPHGGRINMGAYGGTAQASMSLDKVGNTADLNHDGVVNVGDWALFADDWLEERVLMDSDLDRDNDVDVDDLAVFLNNWLD